MKKIFFCLFIISTFFSCAEKEIEIPADVLSKKEMSAILTDIHIAQASVSIKSRNDSSAFSVNDYIAAILKNHKTEKPVFLRSMKFYSNNPEILQQVYDSVITSLSKIQSETEK